MKRLLLIAAVAVMGVSLQAQETRFGAKAGYSFSTIKVDEAQDDLEARSTDPSHTFYIGGLVEHKFGDKFGIQGELLYSPLGGKEDRNASEDDVYFREKTKITFGTLLIPVSAKYFITENLSVSLGASFGVILSAKQKTVVDAGIGIPGLELEGDDDVDIKDDVNTLNIAPFLGAEFALENGLFFDARYNYGISDLSKSDGKVTNSFLQVGVGFKFGGN
ncbi:porin family protein [Chryseobacterium camelliae]|uniref:Porin family protein n=1 Tax=Chryseobacterium camelliae TaxID=1265445 RepID=A0ABY7QM34_9FLAO|nr:porin family protein [Chryseobacterium camelliae]WBV60725.1 porin family protein [Chryseobacterium camelliae]